MAYAEIRCPHCNASGQVDNESNSPFMMGRCPVCNGYVVYFCGASLPLDESTIETHSLPIIRDHILGRIDDFLEERLTEFLEEYAEEFEIAQVPTGETASEESAALPEVQVEAVPLIEPSVLHARTDAITDEEVADFLRIDLELIGRPQYFDRYFKS